jgi:manganese/iron transport system permease protein/iron/zinc/copper transport system permease protein
VTTASFALGVAIISTYRKFSQNFEAALFGNVLGVAPADLWIVTGVTVVLLGLVFFFYRPLLFWCFDREVAQVHGVPVFAMDTLFALMLATLLVATLNVLGVTLIISGGSNSGFDCPTIEQPLWLHDDYFRDSRSRDRICWYLPQLLL